MPTRARLRRGSRPERAVEDGADVDSKGGPVCRSPGEGSSGNGRTPPPPGVRRAGGSPEAAWFGRQSTAAARTPAEGALPLAENLRPRRPPPDPVRGIGGRRGLRLDHGADEFDVLRQREVGAWSSRPPATVAADRLVRQRRLRGFRDGVFGPRVASMLRVRRLPVVRPALGQGFLRPGCLRRPGDVIRPWRPNLPAHRVPRYGGSRPDSTGRR